MKHVLDDVLKGSVSSGDDWETLLGKCRASLVDSKRHISDDEILAKIFRYFPDSGKKYEQAYLEGIERRKIEVQQNGSLNGGGYHRGDKDDMST